MTKKKCTLCNGTGLFYMSRDAHRSAGYIPCNCDKGFVKETEDTKSPKLDFKELKSKYNK